MRFSPCTGKCTEGGSHCQGCGRSHDEIERMGQLVEELASFATEMGYENIEDFAAGVAGSIRYKMGQGH